MDGIQQSIDKLNINNSDKEKLRAEIDQLNREQKDLEGKIEKLERELEEQRDNKRRLERDINEYNIQINTQKASGSTGDNQRVQWLRDEIVKK